MNRHNYKMTQNSTGSSKIVSTSEEGENLKKFKTEVIYKNVLFFLILHLSTLYSAYLTFTVADRKTIIFATICGISSGIGITAGAHRLWSHRSYKARLPLRIFWCILNCIAAQTSIYNWCRDHRVHHKFSETDADPHNIKRGFFFAHIGWLMCKKHPDVTTIGKTVSLEDLWADPVIRYQKKFYIPLVLLFSFYLPIMIPVWFWNETVWNSFFISVIARQRVVLNFTWSVNSAAHMFGNKPYDKNMNASENPVVSCLAFGEGWHNYHHTFPWDYSTSELGYKLNATKIFIDMMSMIGLAYDLKKANPELVKNTKLKNGDGTRLKKSDE